MVNAASSNPTVSTPPSIEAYFAVEVNGRKLCQDHAIVWLYHLRYGFDGAIVPAGAVLVSPIMAGNGRVGSDSM